MRFRGSLYLTGAGRSRQELNRTGGGVGKFLLLCNLAPFSVTTSSSALSLQSFLSSFLPHALCCVPRGGPQRDPHPGGMLRPDDGERMLTCCSYSFYKLSFTTLSNVCLACFFSLLTKKLLFSLFLTTSLHWLLFG